MKGTLQCRLMPFYFAARSSFFSSLLLHIYVNKAGCCLDVILYHSGWLKGKEKEGFDQERGTKVKFSHSLISSASHVTDMDMMIQFRGQISMAFQFQGMDQLNSYAETSYN